MVTQLSIGWDYLLLKEHLELDAQFYVSTQEIEEQSKDQD